MARLCQVQARLHAKRRQVHHAGHKIRNSSERTHGILRHGTRNLSFNAGHTDPAGAHADADRDSVSDDALRGRGISEAELAVVRQRSH